MIVIDLHLGILFILYLAIVCVTLVIHKLKRKNKYNIYGLILFELYILCLVKVVYTPVRIVFDRSINGEMLERMEMNYVNFIPFKTIMGVESIHNFIVQVGGNIILLMPLVFFMYYIFFVKSYRKCAIYGFSTIIFIEITQYIIDIITKFPNKVCDVDDVILNFIGIILSILIIHQLKNTKLEKGIIKFLTNNETRE